MFFRRIVSFFTILIIGGSIVMPAQASQTAKQAASPGDCRFGINVGNWGFIPNESVAKYDLSTVGVGYYLDYYYTRNPSVPGNIHYTYMLRVNDTAYPNILPILPNLVKNNPGSIWIIGNEPDSINDQDNVTAETYADRFFEFAKVIRANDPTTAKISFGSITMMSALRLRYLDYAWARLIFRAGSLSSASALVDFWSPHGFILSEDPNGWGSGIPPAETDAVYNEYLTLAEKITNIDDIYSFDKFTNRLIAFRKWMNANGERNKPLWLTEFGNLLPPYNAPGANFVLAPFPITIDFLQKTFDWMYSTKDAILGDPNDGNRLTQKWFWYSLNDLVTHFGGTLIDPITGIDTPVGTAFRNYDPPLDPGAVVPPPDLAPIAMTVTAISQSPTDRSLVNYRATIRVRNNQINDFLAHGTLSLFEGSNLINNQTIQVARCGGEAVVNIPLNDIMPFSTHNFLVRVQGADQNTVSEMAFNLPGREFTYPYENYFPMVLK